MDRTILHCDLNGFFASVECLFDPALASVPMAVAGNPENRHGIILAKNELAKKFNVQTAETIWQAKRKCPDLVLVPPRRGEYEKYSGLVNDIYLRFTGLVEPFGIDESWLDVTGLCGDGGGMGIADEIRRTVKGELGLTISVGVSFNKIFSKLGSDYKKPDAVTVITREDFRDILFPLPVSSMLYVGRAARETLEKLGIRTIGDLAGSDKPLMESRMGKMGRVIWEYANGLDDSPVKPWGESRDIKSVGNSITFRRDLAGIDDIRTGVYALADEVAGRMRKYGVKCRAVGVTIKNPEFKVITRQKTLDAPTHLAKDIAEAALDLIKGSWNLKLPIRMLTITAMNLVDKDQTYEQTSLFGGEDSLRKDKREKLEAAVDKIREKYGRGAISLGSILKNDLGIDDEIQE